MYPDKVEIAVTRTIINKLKSKIRDVKLLSGAKIYIEIKYWVKQSTITLNNLVVLTKPNI
jgi:hypothetical protein|tara:strand:- start:340 stop:519 length:180 start_codon:yes stop_codon:yes gene_type:complete